MKRHLAVLTLISVLLAPVSAPAGESKKSSGKSPAKAGEKLDWMTFDSAVERAKTQNKHLIVDIYTTWCGWCRVMDKETYGNPEVSAILREHFVLAKVNGEASTKLRWQGQEMTERQFARAVGVTGYPATYFLKPNAEMLGGVGGYIKSPDFLIYARYVSTRWYEKGKIQAYIDSLRASAQ